MKHFTTLLLSLFIFCGCYNKSLKDSIIEIIDLSEALASKGMPTKISEYADEIQYCFLETTDECLIDKIDKVMVDDSLIFIFNKKQFFVFNISGKFERIIGKMGKGPGEYLRIMDFTINADDDLIYIFDSDQRKVISYNYFGELGIEFKLNSSPTCIASLNNEFLIFSWVKPDFIGNDNYGFSKYTMNGNLISKMFNREGENAESSMPSTFLTRLNYYCDSLTYWEINLDTIYRINESGKIIPRYRIDYKRNTQSKDMNKISENVFRYSYFMETDKYLFFLRGVFNNDIKHIIYNKETGEICNIRYNHGDLKHMLTLGFINDIDGGYPFLPVDALKDGRLYCTFFPYELKSLIAERKNDKIEITDKFKQEKLYSKINNSNITDNPVIMLVSMKQKKSHS